MDEAKTLTFYLNTSMRKRAEAGKTNIINRISNAFTARGYVCLFQDDSTKNLLTSAKNPGYSIFHMEDPFHPRALNLRRAYYYPFWRLEASAKRWEWAVANTRFDANDIDQEQAHSFTGYWRRQLFDEGLCPNTQTNTVYIPLQGKLSERRSFQTMSPLDMVKATLQNDNTRQISLALHPRETYSASEMAALEGLIKSDRRLQLVQGERQAHILSCDYIVTENSSLALDGFFHHKPAVLFAETDFHHIGESVSKHGVKKAFRRVQKKTPDFDAYLYWFLQLQSINAGRDDAEEKILATVRAHGWKI